jgi:hypothetical protein
VSYGAIPTVIVVFVALPVNAIVTRSPAAKLVLVNAVLEQAFVPLATVHEPILEPPFFESVIVILLAGEALWIVSP